VIYLLREFIKQADVLNANKLSAEALSTTAIHFGLLHLHQTLLIIFFFL